MNIVWLKRDLRLHDNEAISQAIQQNQKFCLLYILEPSLQRDPHYSARHFSFIKQSILDLNVQLAKFDSQVLYLELEVQDAFDFLKQNCSITTVFSGQETGIKKTYDRDKNISKFFKKNNIVWHEQPSKGVKRGMKNRNKWIEEWNDYVNSSAAFFQPRQNQMLSKKTIMEWSSPIELEKTNSHCQPGGEQNGKKYLEGFLHKRHLGYLKNISKPLGSRIHCSRLSVYLAWGNLSIRQAFQAAKMSRPNSSDKRAINGFISRLRWHSHFIQKFEMECSMEFESLNKTYNNLKKPIIPAWIRMWENGTTGFPLVDACMRCLNATGYLNFRMRALLISFFTHILWQPWQEASFHLSKQFLDFEPGIHYSQLIMQAGETGFNTLRIYNPVRNSFEHDPNGEFIVQWLPELRRVPLSLIHEPWKISAMDQIMYKTRIGQDYPYPIVDFEKARAKASKILWEFRKKPQTIQESKRILAMHVNPKTDKKKGN